MFFFAAQEFLQAAAPPELAPGALSECPRDAALRREGNLRTPPAEYPTAARALPANAPCSPNRYRAAACWPCSSAFPAKRLPPQVLIFLLRLRCDQASPARSARE